MRAIPALLDRQRGRILLAVITLALPGAATGPAWSACQIQSGYPVFQCGDRAWFEPPPEGSGAVHALFWQIGYGNEAINNGEGTNGTGIGPPGIFSGNDSGLWEVPLIRAAPVVDPTGAAGLPEDALCLGPVNWGNRGVDGCCDNRRELSTPRASDGLLNANFDIEAMSREKRFAPDLKAVVDYPMAVLLREESGGWFAVAAVSSFERPTDQPDIRPGHFTLAAVSDGKVNPLTGARNIIPWQAAPRLKLTADPAGAGAGKGRTGAAGSGAGGGRTFKASWDPVVVPSDRSRRPSTGWKIDTPGGGVGVADLGPLVSYSLERVRLLPEMIGPGGIPIREILLWEKVLASEKPEGMVDLAEDSCARAVVHLGMRPAFAGAEPFTCALGRCGDIGYEIPGPPVCLEGPLLARTRGGR